MPYQIIKTQISQTEVSVRGSPSAKEGAVGSGHAAVSGLGKIMAQIDNLIIKIMVRMTHQIIKTIVKSHIIISIIKALAKMALQVTKIMGKEMINKMTIIHKIILIQITVILEAKVETEAEAAVIVVEEAIL